MLLSGAVLIVDSQPEESCRLHFAEGTPKPVLCYARNAGSAIRLARSQAFSHFVVSSDLPDFDGLELFQLLKEILPQTPGTIISDKYSPDTEIAARVCGATSYLCKPLSKEMLEALLT